MRPQLNRNVQSRIEHIGLRCKTVEQVTRVWNWIDHQDVPEPLWETLAESCPWAYRDEKYPNSLWYEYHTGTKQYSKAKKRAEALVAIHTICERGKADTGLLEEFETLESDYGLPTIIATLALYLLGQANDIGLSVSEPGAAIALDLLATRLLGKNVTTGEIDRSMSHA